MADNEKNSEVVKEAAVADAPAVEAVEGEATTEGATPKENRRSKSGRVVPVGIAFINATFNNTKVTFTDLHGNTLCWSSAGKMGIKGSRKSTAYAAQQVAADAAKRAQMLGMREVEVRIKGPGAGRESAVRGIVAAGMDISVLKDVTPVPHNGCRPPKRRRV
jgi:small subunit ribosomal protein S11